MYFLLNNLFSARLLHFYYVVNKEMVVSKRKIETPIGLDVRDR